MTQATGSTIAFDARVEAIDAATLVRLPAEASRSLPSRGQVAVHGSIDDQPIRTVVEPDGRRGHWIKVDPALGLGAGDEVSVRVEVDSTWPEPDVPADLASALDAAPAEIAAVWQDITSMARWEWVRWVNATANPATRARRVEVSIDKIANGKRRPCCFDLSSCTDPDLAKSGKLRDGP